MGARRCLLLCLALAASAAALAVGATRTTAREDATMVQVDVQPPAGESPYYVANREPLTPSPLIKLPIGAIKPKGWLLEQLRLEAEGFIGYLTEISPWCKAEGSAWMSPTGEGERGWEELPYWLKGFGDLGYILGDERIIAEARRWIDACLASQDSEGYFGPRANKANNDLWPNMIMLNVLQSFYEATGDERVLPFMSRYFRWQLTQGENLFPGSWQKVRAGDNLASVYWLYNRTGGAWLLDLARLIHQRCEDWTSGIASWHGVNIAQGFKEPAIYYQQAKDRSLLEAAERNYQTVREKFGQVPGGMYGADENCREGYYGPRQATETCAMVEMMLSDEMLLAITGEVQYADRCEDVAFNMFPASMTPDLNGLHYLTAPNMVQLDRTSKAPLLQNGGNMLAYDPWDYRCCQHNVSHGWPYYAEHLWMATGARGLAACLYVACEVEAKVGDGTVVGITQETDYPFGETVRLRLRMPKAVTFPLTLRIPGWCEGARASINGEPLNAKPRPGSWLTIHRPWHDGDRVELSLPMRVTLRFWERNRNTVSVDYGPLTFSLKIGERWQRYGGTDEWPAYEVFPTTPWNYGLVLEGPHPTANFSVVKRRGALAHQPWTVENAPVTILTKGRRIPEWKLEANGLIGEVQESPALTKEPIEEITLVPMGCARLRVSAFPTVTEGPEGHKWSEPPKAPQASHCCPWDTTLALNDGILPQKSADTSIPRFTWWDHRGTTEWVQYDFDEPRRLSWAEVYWFDDTGFGQCRVPKSWRLLYRDGDQWKPVETTDEYGVELDKFNRVTFKPVETTGLRLEVELQPEFSGGILEWRVGN